MRKDYIELISLIKQLLLQEHDPKDHLIVSPKNYPSLQRWASLPPLKKPSSPPPSPRNPSPPSQKSSPPSLPRTATKKAAPLKTEKLKPRHNNKPQPLKPIPQPQQSEKKAVFHLDPPKPTTPDPLTEIRQTFKEIFPIIKLHETPPNDTVAHQVINGWRQRSKSPEVIILSLEEKPQNKEFLHNVAKAIRSLLAPTIMLSANSLEIENKWEQLLEQKNVKLILCQERLFQIYPELLQHYKKPESQKKTPLLGTIPLLFLSETDEYIKNPMLKASLWESLSHFLG